MTFPVLPPERASNRAMYPPTQRFAVYAIWGVWVGLVFFSIYPTMNWLTGQRTGHNELFFQVELGLPFVPEFIWVYLSMYALFLLPPFFLNPLELKRLASELIIATIVSGAIFLLLPARLGFERALPEAPVYKAIFQGIFSVDQPFNLVPSLHIVYSTAISFAVIAQAGRYTRRFMVIWLLMIMASTVLVHQHHLLDVVTGFMLAVLMRTLLEKRYA